MQLIYAYGFSVDADTKRVYLNDGKVAGFNQSIPQGAEGITKGSDKGEVVGKTAKVGYNAQLNLVYNDTKGKPYAGKVTIYADLPHDEAGKLLVDSVGAIKEYKHGLAFTVNDVVAMDATQSLQAPKLNAVYPAKNSVVLDFDATEGEEALIYTGYAIGGGKTFKAEVYDPDEDLAIEELTEGVTYECYVTASINTGIVSAPSNKISVTCKTVIKAPVFKSCVAGDGFATVTFDPVEVSDPWTIDHYAYSAINMDDKDAPEVEGHIENNKIILPNDITWYVRICAVCNPARVPGDFSDALSVKPEKESVPYQPVINTCYVQSGGQIVTEWAKGTNGNRNQSAMTVDKWQVRYKSADGKGADFQQDTDAATTKATSQKVNIGKWEVTVLAHNDMGWSEPSKPVGVEYIPTVNDPLMGGTAYQDDLYKYRLFQSNETTGYEAVRTEEGKNVEFEVLLCGAGGAGKGQTTLLAKGGDGGGGQLVIGKLPPAYAGSIFITVPNGGSQAGNSPANTTVKEGDVTLVAIAGKTATDKNDAVGYPKQPVPDGWKNLSEFSWLKPVTEFVGGVATAGEQNYPNSSNCGSGGAGTKENKAGKGGNSFVAIRWKK